MITSGLANERETSFPTVNVLNILKNPMILLGLVSMGIFIGMPYLVDNSKSPLPRPVITEN